MQLPPDLEIGPKMQACSARERLFVWFFVTGDGEPEKAGNQTEAARAAGYTDSGDAGIRVRGHQLAHRPRVIEAIEEVGKRAFRSQLVEAIKANRALITDPRHPDHNKAVQATLSRLGLAERVGIDVNHSGEVTLNHTDAALETLRYLRDLRVPREVLEQHFGYSGLERYERMLEEADRRAPKVIEGRVVDAHKD